jgi:hypothetical protein
MFWRSKFDFGGGVKSTLLFQKIPKKFLEKFFSFLMSENLKKRTYFDFS